jgi:hypothetical protein
MNRFVYAFKYHSIDTLTLYITASDMLEAFMTFREHKDGDVYTLLEIKLIGEALSDV